MELNKGWYVDIVTANDNPQRQISKAKAGHWNSSSDFRHSNELNSQNIESEVQVTMMAYGKIWGHSSWSQQWRWKVVMSMAGLQLHNKRQPFLNLCIHSCMQKLFASSTYFMLKRNRASLNPTFMELPFLSFSPAPICQLLQELISTTK